MRHQTLRVYQKRRTGNSHVCLAIHALLLPNAILLGNCCANVAEQGFVQLVGLGKFLQQSGLVWANAKGNDIVSFKFFKVSADVARLYRAAGGKGFGVKEDQYCFSTKIRQFYWGAGGIWQTKIRRNAAYGGHGHGACFLNNVEWHYCNRVETNVQMTGEGAGQVRCYRLTYGP